MRTLASPLRLAAAALLLGAAPTPAQDTDADPPPEPREPQAEDLHAEIGRLLGDVERRLARIDAELYDAAAGAAPLEEVEDAGLADLLRASRDEMQAVVDGIDRILAIRHEHPPGGS